MSTNHLMEDLNVLAKVSEKCPLSCVYCYEGEKSDKIMDDKTLERMVNFLETRKGVRRTGYIWHGAEPLTAGIEFYKKARKLQKSFEKDHTIKNSIQSSGVLLTPKFADFLVEEKFGIGFSLDGPEHVHNKTRIYRTGVGSFKDVMRGINLMTERGMKPGVIAVLSKESLPFLDEIYDFFKEEGLDFKINPIMKCGYAKNSQLHLSPQERVHAITHLFDRWFFDLKEGHQVEYGNMMSIAKAMFTKEGTSCDMLPSCQESFISVGTEGTIYPCSRFSDKETFYGNIHQTDSFQEIIDSPLRKKHLNRFEKNLSCQKCDYDFLCYSGCMHNAYVEGNIFDKDPNCGSNKKIYEHISKRIIDQLDADKAI